MSVFARPRPRLGRVEFTSLLALSMSLTALGIDVMLPAFGAIRSDLGLPADSVRVAGAVTTYVLGLAIGQLAYGPLSDRFGRKPILYVGYGLYFVAALASAIAPDLSFLLAARFIWGLGAAGPRVITAAIVRDRFEGEAMARAMSFIFAVFIVVPILAPSLGALILTLGSWRWVFGLCAVAALVMALWAMRLVESLDTAHRLELRPRRLYEAGRTVLTHRHTVGYTAALTLLTGAFLSYLASSEIIFGEVFGLAREFPVLFGALAAVMGAAMLANARMVGRVGTRRMAHLVLETYVVLTVLFAGAMWVTGGRPPVALFVIGMAAVLAAHALMIPNFNTVALQPMAAIAGTASAVIGTVSTAGGAGIGFLIDRSFDGTVLPLAVAFAFLGVLALGCIAWAERGKLLGPGRSPKGAPAPPEAPADLPLDL